MRQKQKRKAGAPGERREKTAFRLVAEAKGWLMRDIAERWDIHPVNLSRQTRQPDQKTLDALNGLPDRRESNGEGESEQEAPEG